MHLYKMAVCSHQGLRLKCRLDAAVGAIATGAAAGWGVREAIGGVPCAANLAAALQKPLNADKVFPLGGANGRISDNGYRCPVQEEEIDAGQRRVDPLRSAGIIW